MPLLRRHSRHWSPYREAFLCEAFRSVPGISIIESQLSVFLPLFPADFHTVSPQPICERASLGISRDTSATTARSERVRHLPSSGRNIRFVEHFACQRGSR